MSFDANGVICTDINKAWLNILNENDITKMSVCEIYNKDVFANGKPIDNGLHDLRLGPISGTQPCLTCDKRYDCPGHIGIINLALPVFHPIFLNLLLQLLKCVCFHCCRLKINKDNFDIIVNKFFLIETGNLTILEEYNELLLHNRSSNDISNDEGKIKFRKLSKQIQELRNTIHFNDNVNKISLHLSSNSTLLKLWKKLCQEAFEIMQKRKCTHCNESCDAIIKKNKLNTMIGIEWNTKHKPPIPKSFFLYYIDKELEIEKTNINNVATIAASEMIEKYTYDDLCGKFQKYGKRGKKLISLNLAAYQIYPVLKKLFNSNDKYLLYYLIPTSIAAQHRLFFMSIMPVSSNKFRPITEMKGSGYNPINYLHNRSNKLLDILKANTNLFVILNILRYEKREEYYENTKKFFSSCTIPDIDLTNKDDMDKFIKQSQNDYNALFNYAQKLQEAVCTYVDNSKTVGNDASPGIKQWLDKKSGAVRQNMMGKRVNYAARTIIAPDCQLNTNEVGIPKEFALRLTIPEAVNQHNYKYLCKLILNGAYKYPGCNMILDDTGKKLDFVKRPITMSQREMYCSAIKNYVKRLNDVKLKQSKPYIVYRHLRNGDVVLMNRQPSLHRSSIMAHFIRILEGQKAFRLHYSNCSSYNADFDGDEMNLHCLQDFYSRAEASIIMNADCNYSTPKNGESLRGIIQDHVIGGTFLTSRSTFLDKNAYVQLVYVGVYSFVNRYGIYDVNTKSVILNQSTSGDLFARRLGADNIRIIIDYPSIIKPQKLWTGKQVITAVMKTIINTITISYFGKNENNEIDYDFVSNFKGINLTSTSKTPGDAWNGQLDGDKEESTVVIQDSELLQGVFDKDQFGASSYGLIHLCNELLGPRVAGILLSAFSRIFSAYLQMTGFSCAASDFILTDKGKTIRNRLVNQCNIVGIILQKQFIDNIYKEMNWTEANITFDNIMKTEDKIQAYHSFQKLFTLDNNGSLMIKNEYLDKDIIALKEIDAIYENEYNVNSESNKLYLNNPGNIKLSLSRSIRSNAAKNDLAPINEKSLGEYIAKKYCELTKNLDSVEELNKALFYHLLTNSQLSYYFPQLNAILKNSLNSISNKYLGNPSYYNGNIVKKLKLEHELYNNCVSHYIQIAYDGIGVCVDGTRKTYRKYYPSWASTNNNNVINLDDKISYQINFLKKTHHYSSKNKDQSYALPVASLLTKFRMERVIKDHFLGTEKTLLDLFDKYFQINMSKITSKNNNLVNGKATMYSFPRNGFSSMVTTGAKGSKLNFAMICGMVSQQSLEGKRVPVMISGKTHPAFSQWDLGARSGGLITDNYLTGLRPQEYFFHCMAGREGLIDTAIKTASSGYLQRCIIKSLEGVNVCYDGTVRDSDGTIIQFLYGEDGIDVCKAAYLNKLDYLLQNAVLGKKKYLNNTTINSERIVKTINSLLNYEKTNKIDADNLYDLRDKNSKNFNELNVLTNVFSPMQHPCSVSENYLRSSYEQILKFIDDPAMSRLLLNAQLLKKSDYRKNRLLIDKEGHMSNLAKLARIKYTSSLQEAGDAVGCMAAHSIGEPATQMTLNTFHLAGHGAANVTLGIPRLREILTTANTAATPVSFIPIRGTDKNDVINNAKTILDRFNKIGLSDLISSVGIESNYCLTNINENTNVVNEIDTYKYYNYDCVIQLENIDHFCESVQQYNTEQVIMYIFNIIVKKICRLINRLVSLYAIKASEEEFCEYDNEITLAADKYMFNKNKQIVDKRSLFKDKLKSAGFTSTKSSMQTEVYDFEHHSKPKSDAEDIIYSEAIETNDEEVENDIKANKNEDEFGDAKYDSDNSYDDSDENYNNAATDKYENNSDEDKESKVNDEYISFMDDYDTSDVESISDTETLDGIKEKSLKKVPKLIKQSTIPQYGYKYLKSIKFCKRTWKLNICWSVSVQKCPRRIEFLPSLIKLIKEQNFSDIKGFKEAFIVSAQDVRTKHADGTKPMAEIQSYGNNLPYLWSFLEAYVDHSFIYTNDISSIFKYYGVEAGRLAIIRELVSVFDAYGIQVNYRHLSLIAEYMSLSGEYRGFSRKGISDNTSPFLQMSFETSFKFLTDAVTRNAVDNLKTPAGSIFVGKQPFTGTGVCQILTKVIN